MTTALIFLDRQRDGERIQRVWQALSANEPSYFLSWGWVENWLASLPADVPARLAVVERGGEPVLAFFLGEAGVVRKKVFRAQSLFLNATGCEPYDSLCIERNAILGRATFTLPELLALLPDGWEEFHLPGLDCQRFPGNAVLQPLESYTVQFDKDVPSPYVDLSAVCRAPDGYLSLLSANTRSQVRRAYRGFGDVTTEAAVSADHALVIYEELVKLHQAAWQARGEPGAFAVPYFDRFHRDLIRKRFAHGEIQLLRVLAGSETVGCFYNFVCQGRVAFYQSGLRYETDPKLKPGLVCHAEAIQFNAAHGQQVYDFLGGAARYKASLATHNDRLVWARIQKPRAKFWIESRLRQVKRAVKHER